MGHTINLNTGLNIGLNTDLNADLTAEAFGFVADIARMGRAWTSPSLFDQPPILLTIAEAARLRSISRTLT